MITGFLVGIALVGLIYGLSPLFVGGEPREEVKYSPFPRTWRKHGDM